MLTMQPSIMLGSYVWAQDRLPIDEFQLRLEEVRFHMSRNGWKGLLIYGDAREHGALAYLSNFIPRMRWGMALLALDGDPRLLCSMSTRDLPAMQTMTWIRDVRSGWEWSKSFDSWFERFGGQSVAFGTVGFDRMTPALYQSVGSSLGDRLVLEHADDLVKLPPGGKRPRELSMIRHACTVLDASAKAFVESWRQSGATERAALDAERVARGMAAQDVRTLVSLDGGQTLVPFQGQFEAATVPLVGYIAVKVLGYWADGFVTAAAHEIPAARQAEAALDSLLAAVRPGLAAGDAYEKVVTALRPFRLHPALGGSVGHGIGLSLHEGAEFRDGCREILEEDGVYTLQVGVADQPPNCVLISAVIRNTARGAELLVRLPSLES